ncbi:MAG: M35 family metallo-endopeptidase [Bacteroidota bacterium]
MPMKKFTDVYTQARNVVVSQKFEAEWQKFLSDTCHVPGLLAADGFQSAHANGLEKLRAKIKTDATAPQTPGKVIIAAAQSTGGSLAARAATLKMLSGTYLIQHTGGQDVWVYSPPKAHGGWIFDEIVGSPEVIEPKLSQTEEIFSRTEMDWMGSALKLALKISEDTKAKLASASAETKAVVKRWFCDEDSTGEDVTAAVEKLSSGFKKIAVACGSGTLVFTDYADWRAQRDKYFGGAIPGGEGGGFPVIYLEGAFTRLTGNTGKQWLCVETIIHEFSHHEVRTRDHRYDSSGLKPAKAGFPYAKAIENADSWGYFALDLSGYLSEADRMRTLK